MLQPVIVVLLRSLDLLSSRANQSRILGAIENEEEFEDDLQNLALQVNGTTRTKAPSELVVRSCDKPDAEKAVICSGQTFASACPRSDTTGCIG